MSSLLRTELAKLLLVQREAEAPQVDLLALLCPPQRRLATSVAKRIAVGTSRRSGKSYAACVKGLKVCLEKANINVYLVSITRKNAKHLFWNLALELNARHHLGGNPNHTDLELRFPNGSRLMVGGCADKSEIDLWRGNGNAEFCAIDECGFWGDYLESFVRDVLRPILSDNDGQLWLLSTPPVVNTGYYYRCYTQGGAWEAHTWHLRDNPHYLKGRDANAILLEEAQARGFASLADVDEPFRREWLGEFCGSTSGTLLSWSDAINVADGQVPEFEHYVIGVDTGVVDPDHITVLGFSDDSPRVRLVHEDSAKGQTNTQLLGKLLKLRDQYQPLVMAIDPAAGGKKNATTWYTDHGLVMKSAEKANKAQHIRALQDHMRRGDFVAPRGSLFAKACQLIEWNADHTREKEYSTHDGLVDAIDATLYAFNEAVHYVLKANLVEPEPERRDLLRDEPEEPDAQVDDVPWYAQQVA